MTASAQVTVVTSSQVGTANTWPFTPTWTPTPNSLIAGLAPTTATGNFSEELPGRNVNSLTSGGSLTLDQVAATIVGNKTASTNYVTYGNGSGAGSQLIYTLPASANGYNLTNITVDGGWANNGRDALGFTVLYSTVANPTNFIYLTTVSYNPTVPNNTPSATQAIIKNAAAGGVIAANVAVVEFILNFPSVENGFCGIGAITVEGTAAASQTPVVTMTAANQSGTSPFTPTWTPESPNLISGLLPSSSSGNFALETSAGLPVLTDGIMGVSGDHTTLATCGASGGSSLVYTMTNTMNGEDITNIIVYSGWGDTGRAGQYYTISYSTIAAPTAYIPITTVFYWPGQSNSGGSAQANRVSVYNSTGAILAGGVANLKFDFASPISASGFNNGYQGYSEIIVQGQDTATPPPPPSPVLTQDTLPASAATVVGDQVVFTATYSNIPPANLQWVRINDGVTNVLDSQTNSTLTLSNVQLSDSGTYALEAFNATNNAAAPSISSGSALVVNSVAAPVNNIIINYASQVGLGPISPVNASTNFYPTWTENTDGDLILNSVDGGSFPGNPGEVYAGLGNFAPLGSACNGDPMILSDGDSGYQNYYPTVGGNLTLDSCGNTAGNSVIYTLPTSATGWSLTNITVYGGWGDNGRDEQKYQVLYSTVSAPTVFNNLVSVDYNPTIPGSRQSAIRTMVIPAAGSLAQNVYAVEINFFNAGSSSENGWSGYSEIVVAGQPSTAAPVLTQNITPATAEDVVGSSLTLTASFDGATSYQWLKDGTNISGATGPTLTLNNLQLTDTATNSGYSVVAYNSSGSNVTAACAVVVNPVPAATNNIVTAFAIQTSASAGFSPTWDISGLSSSLIANQSAPNGGYDPNGDFNDPDVTPAAFNQAGGLPVLTDGNYGSFVNTGPHPAFATCGPSAGAYVIYTLGSDPNGYTITNLQIAGGWNDNGRDSQYYTVSYSTVANPTLFFPLTTVANDLSTYGVSDETMVRATITATTGVLASNVYAVYIDFTVPPGVPNGYSGYNEISVFGAPSVAAPPANGPVITTQHEETNTDWVVETPNLIANQLPSSYGTGVFTEEGCNVTNLTDGVIGFGADYGASCGDDGIAVPWIVFNSANGWNLTNIVVYTLWHDYGRDGQYYSISYSTLSDPNTFIPLTSVAYNPYVPHDGRPSGNRVAISPAVGQTTLATNVAAVKFDFTSQGVQDFGWSGYSEIVLQGSSLPGPLAVGTVSISGGNLILTGAGGTPNGTYTWLTSTNLTTPLADWTVGGSGTFDGNGAFSNAIPVNAVQPAGFFRLRMP